MVAPVQWVTGKVWLAQLGHTVGSEIQKTRPCVLISPPEMHNHLRAVIIAPMATGSRPAAFRVPITFKGKTGLILLDQIRTLDKVRLVRREGAVYSATSACSRARARTCAAQALPSTLPVGGADRPHLLGVPAAVPAVRWADANSIAFIMHSVETRQILNHIGVESESPRIAPARGPPLWEDWDANAQEGQGARVEPDWDLAGQPAPDYEVGQRINCRAIKTMIETAV